MKTKILRVLMLLVITVSMAGCAGTCQRIKADGSLIGTKVGNWIVIKQSGGVITDVFKLENVFVQSEQGSDGWLFVDTNNNACHIGGDMKATRVDNNKEKIFNSYFEFHMEFDTLTYIQRLKVRLKNGTPLPQKLEGQTFILEN